MTSSIGTIVTASKGRDGTGRRGGQGKSPAILFTENG